MALFGNPQWDWLFEQNPGYQEGGASAPLAPAPVATPAPAIPDPYANLRGKAGWEWLTSQAPAPQAAAPSISYGALSGSPAPVFPSGDQGPGAPSIPAAPAPRSAPVIPYEYKGPAGWGQYTSPAGVPFAVDPSGKSYNLRDPGAAFDAWKVAGSPDYNRLVFQGTPGYQSTNPRISYDMAEEMRASFTPDYWKGTSWGDAGPARPGGAWSAPGTPGPGGSTGAGGPGGAAEGGDGVPILGLDGKPIEGTATLSPAVKAGIKADQARMAARMKEIEDRNYGLEADKVNILKATQEAAAAYNNALAQSKDRELALQAARDAMDASLRQQGVAIQQQTLALQRQKLAQDRQRRQPLRRAPVRIV